MNLIHTVKFYVVIGIIFVLFFTMNKNIYGENIKEYTIKLVIFKGDFDFRIDLSLMVPG